MCHLCSINHFVEDEWQEEDGELTPCQTAIYQPVYPQDDDDVAKQSLLAPTILAGSSF